MEFKRLVKGIAFMGLIIVCFALQAFLVKAEITKVNVNEPLVAYLSYSEAGQLVEIKNSTPYMASGEYLCLDGNGELIKSVEINNLRPYGSYYLKLDNLQQGGYYQIQNVEYYVLAHQEPCYDYISYDTYETSYYYTSIIINDELNYQSTQFRNLVIYLQKQLSYSQEGGMVAFLFDEHSEALEIDGETYYDPSKALYLLAIDSQLEKAYLYSLANENEEVWKLEF